MRRGWFAFSCLVAAVVFVAAHFLDFPGSVPDFVKESGGGTLLDMKPEFSEDGLYARLESFGEPGRANYAFRLMTVDLILPLALLPLLLLMMWKAAQRLSVPKAFRVILLSLPVAYVLLDLAENGSLLAILAGFPARLRLTAAVLPYLTVIKRAASLLSLFLPVLLLGFESIRQRVR